MMNGAAGKRVRRTVVNALVHRDHLVSAPARLFVYDNRIEIISPGHLPDPDVLAEEIIENLEAGVDSFKQIMESINGR